MRSADSKKEVRPLFCFVFVMIHCNYLPRKAIIKCMRQSIVIFFVLALIVSQSDSVVYAATVCGNEFIYVNQTLNYSYACPHLEDTQADRRWKYCLTCG